MREIFNKRRGGERKEGGDFNYISLVHNMKRVKRGEWIF